MKRSPWVFIVLGLGALNTAHAQPAAVPAKTAAKTAAKTGAPKADVAKPATEAPADEAPADEAEKPAPAAEAEKSGTRVLVLPYQAVFRSVPQKQLDIATGLLQKELGAQSDFKVIRGAVGSADSGKPTVTAANDAVKAATSAETERRIQDAIGAWKTAVAEFETNAGAFDKNSIKPYVDAIHSLARAFMLAGLDKEAKDTIEQAARVAPNHALEADNFSRLYQRWFADAATRALDDRGGKILVTSVLPGARIELDGRPTDVAPVLLEKVVPGRHVIVARIDGVTPFATTVTVKAGEKLEVVARYAGTMGGDQVGAVTDAIAQNTIPAKAVSSAAAAGKGAGAKWVIFGAMAKDDDKYRVHTYVLDIAGSKIKELPSLNFDLELLTAESDVLRIVRDATATIEAFPADAIASIKTIETRMRATNTTNRFNASPQFADVSADETPTAKKKGRRPVFRPLKGGKIMIKDEEEK